MKIATRMDMKMALPQLKGLFVKETPRFKVSSSYSKFFGVKNAALYNMKRGLATLFAGAMMLPMIFGCSKGNLASGGAEEPTPTTAEAMDESSSKQRISGNRVWLLSDYEDVAYAEAECNRMIERYDKTKDSTFISFTSLSLAKLYIKPTG